ncbi:hypothetical protein GCM10011425_34840 [Mucilaginibacter galii]|uniref:Glycosyltransferase 2-like domain-containing protein n=2 Tax=Mucilaginibacter galii TaxID=2005073 RepID=A0A917JCW7_9SPHI|nr:hypothetical protein GCM10011425_34840 [Mucilaginibacter galii]
MNRLHQLKQTLPKNIKEGVDYENIEYVLLDYNSGDGLEHWVKDNMADYIQMGKLTYYKTTDPMTWNPSHSKNIAFKLATGDIICNLWADYYIGKTFVQYLDMLFTDNADIVLTPIDFHKTKTDHHPPGDVLGKVCVKKADFTKVRGFDERMNKHGFEDYDFINRLEMIGIKRVLLDDINFMQYIPHQNSERYNLSSHDLKHLYINYQTPFLSEILLLYNDQSFAKGFFIDNISKNADNYIYAYHSRNERFDYDLQEPGWETGDWAQQDNSSILLLNKSNNQNYIFRHSDDKQWILEGDNHAVFYQHTDEIIINDVLTFKHFVDTRSIMNENLNNNKSVVNQDYGQATVYKNFSPTPIII